MTYEAFSLNIYYILKIWGAFLLLLLMEQCQADPGADPTLGLIGRIISAAFESSAADQSADDGGHGHGGGHHGNRGHGHNGGGHGHHGGKGTTSGMNSC